MHLFGQRFMLQTLVSHVGSRCVWRALDTFTRQPVALKGSFDPADDIVGEFRRLERAQHPRLVTALELGRYPCDYFGVSQPLTWMTQEWLDSPSLVSLAGTLSVDALWQLAGESLELLAFLQARGLTRLDLKPQHFFLTAAGWKLIDLDQAQADRPLAGPALHGTLAYTAPESLLGMTGGTSADLYSLGAVLYCAVTGLAPPLSGASLEELQRFRLQWIPLLPPALSRDSPTLEVLISRLLRPLPSDRPVSAQAGLELLGLQAHRWRSGGLPHSAEVGWTLLWPNLLSQLDALCLQQGGGLLLSGGPGSGRTRLLRSLRNVLQLRGLPVAHLAAAAALAEWIPESSLEPTEGPDDSTAPVLSLLQVLAQRLSSGAEPPAGPTEPDPLVRLQRLAQAHLDRFNTPLIALLDQGESAAPVLLEVLERIACYLPGSGLVLILATTPEQAGRQGLGMLPRQDLPLLDPDSIRLLVEDLLGEGFFRARAQADPLLKAAGGVPGRLRALLQPLWADPQELAEMQTGSAAAREDSQFLPASPAADLTSSEASAKPEASPRLHTALALLEGELWLAAGLLAHLPLRFSHQSACTQLNALTCNEQMTLDELVRCGALWSLQAAEGEGSAYSFRSRSLRRVFNGEDAGAFALDGDGITSPVLSPAQHILLAEALEAALLNSSESLSPAIALHFLRAGESARARPYLLMTVKDLGQRPAESVLILQALASLIAPSEPAGPELWRILGEARVSLGNLPGACDALRESLARLPERAPLRYRLCGRLGELLVSLGVRTEAQQHLEVALSSLPERSNPSREHIGWLHKLAWLKLLQREASQARGLLQQARVLARSFRTATSVHSSASNAELESGFLPSEQVNALYLEALLAFTAGEDTRPHEPQLQQALQLARTLKAPEHETKVLNLLARLARQRGDRPATRQALQALVARARASWDPGQEALAAYNMGTFLLEEGADTEALDHFSRASLLATARGNQRLALQALLEGVSILLEHNRLERAELELEQVQRLLEGEVLPPVVTCAARLLQTRLRLLRALAAEVPSPSELLEVGQALASLAADLPPHLELRLELTADQLRLALALQQPQQALETFYAVQQVQKSQDQVTVAPRLWARLHRLAIQAHQACLGENGAPEATQVAHGLVPISASVPAEAPGELAPVPAPAERRSVQARTGAAEVSLSASDWLKSLERLLKVADNEALLAAALAELAGSLVQGRGLVVLFDGNRPLVGRGFSLEVHEIDDVSSTLIEQVRRERKPFICGDVRASTVLGNIRSLREARVRSVLCQPVLLDNACLGVLYIDHVEAGRVTEPSTLTVIEQVAGLAAGLLQSVLMRRFRPERDTSDFGLVGTSKPMQQLRARLSTLAASPSPDLVVLIEGETGTGKSTIARRLHQQGQRKSGPFVPVNAAAIPETLFESLLYGYSKGAFTGALTSSPGWLESAKGGTLFFDEVAEMPLTQQARLLETLGGSRSFRRLGDQKEHFLDAQLICATSRTLQAEVRAGRFRPELLRRIQVNPCRIPSLRERGAEDILLLSQTLITRYLVSHGLLNETSPPVALEDYLTRPGREFLVHYDWPFNVGQLENVFRHEGIRAQLRSRGQEKVDRAALQEALGQVEQSPWTRLATQGSEAETPPEGLSYKEIGDWFEQQKARHIRALHQSAGSSVTALARQLRCSRDVIYKYLQPEDAQT